MYACLKRMRGTRGGVPSEPRYTKREEGDYFWNLPSPSLHPARSSNPCMYILQ